MELHVAALHARTRPGLMDAAFARIAALPVSEVRAAGADGRVVALLAAADPILPADRLARIPPVPGVRCAMLDYEHHEGEEEKRDGST